MQVHSAFNHNAYCVRNKCIHVHNNLCSLHSTAIKLKQPRRFIAIVINHCGLKSTDLYLWIQCFIYNIYTQCSIHWLFNIKVPPPPFKKKSVQRGGWLSRQRVARIFLFSFGTHCVHFSIKSSLCMYR